MAATQVEEAERLQWVATTILGGKGLVMVMVVMVMMVVMMVGASANRVHRIRHSRHPFDDGFEDEFERDERRLHATLRVCTCASIRIALT